MTIKDYEKLKKLLKGFEPQSELAAAMYIITGVGYFMKHHKIKTLAVLTAVLTILTVAYNLVAPEGLDIRPYKPVGELLEPGRAEIALVRQTAQDPLRVVVDGQFLGRMDTTWVMFKPVGENIIVIFDRHTKEAEAISYPFNRDRMKQYQKKR